MSIEKMREEFEVWASTHRMPLHKDGVVVTYAARCADEAWQAWQASRAALVVELPERMPAFSGKSDYWDGAHNGFNQCLDTCKAHFEFAGLKVKS